LANLPTNAIDIDFVVIDSKRAIPIPVEEYSRLISGNDVFLSPTGSRNRFLYVFEGKNTTSGQLRYAPAVNKTVTYHIVPYLSDFDSSKNTRFPTELFDTAAQYATYLAFQANEDLDLASAWKATVTETIQSKGSRIKSNFMV
jgi:hypothetical protein